MSSESTKFSHLNSAHLEMCRRAFFVALVVGSVLNLINQGDLIFNGGDVDAGKLVLTYLVPFFVSAHGAFLGRKAEQLNTENTLKERA